MQAKDVPDVPVLEFLASLSVWANWCWPDSGLCVAHAMPPETPSKVVLAKMRQLIKRGLVSGCGCGCRGDFEITEKGREYLAKQNENPPLQSRQRRD